jgi:hypothetical protein
MERSSKQLDATGWGFECRDFADVLERRGHVSMIIRKRYPELHTVQPSRILAWRLLRVRDAVA